MVDSSTQIPARDQIKEEREDKKETNKEVKDEIKKEIENDQGSPQNDDNVKAEPAVRDPKIMEETVVEEDVPAIVPAGASSLDVERGIKKPTKAPDQTDVVSPILSSRNPRPRIGTALAASPVPGEPGALARPVAPPQNERLFHDLDTRVAAPTLLSLRPAPDLVLNSLLKYEGMLKQVHDANYNGLSKTGDYAGKLKNLVPFLITKNLIFWLIWLLIKRCF